MVTRASVITSAIWLGVLAVISDQDDRGPDGTVAPTAAVEEIVNAFHFAQLTSMTSGRETRVVIGAPEDRIAVRQYQTTADLFGGGDELVAGDVVRIPPVRMAPEVLDYVVDLAAVVGHDDVEPEVVGQRCGVEVGVAHRHTGDLGQRVMHQLVLEDIRDIPDFRLRVNIS